MSEQVLILASVQQGIHVNGSRNNTAQEKGDMGKKNYQLSPELMPYALSRSFSHTSYRICHVPLSHIAPYVPVSGKPLQMWHARDWHIRSNELKELVLSACVPVSYVCILYMRSCYPTFRRLVVQM